MKVARLSTTDQILHNATHKFTIDYADVAALGAATTGVIALVPETGTAPAGTVFGFAKMVITSNTWAGASVTALTAQIGITGGDTDALMPATEICLAGTEIVHTVVGTVTQPLVLNTADSIDILFTSTGANLNVITAGEIEVYLQVTSPFTDLAVVDGV